MKKSRLLLALGSLFLSSPTQAASHPTALQCLNHFLTRIEKIQSYRAILHKTEYDADGDLQNQEKLELEQRKPVTTRVTYLNEGLTGIKNNGMTAEYDGSGWITPG